MFFTKKRLSDLERKLPRKRKADAKPKLPPELLAAAADARRVGIRRLPDQVVAALAAAELLDVNRLDVDDLARVQRLCPPSAQLVAWVMSIPSGQVMSAIQEVRKQGKTK